MSLIEYIKEIINVDRLVDFGVLLRSPTCFFKDRIGRDEASLRKSIIGFAYLSGAAMLLLSASLNTQGQALASPSAFLLSNVILVFVSSLAAYAGWRIVTTNVDYLQLLALFFYAQGVTFLVVVMALVSLMAGESHLFEYWGYGVGVSAVLLLLWQVAVWRAIHLRYRVSLLKSATAFIVYMACYVPVAKMFMGLSTLVGNVA